MPYKTLPDITEHQEIILENVYRFRFINRIQLQKIFGHKDPRRINAWLKDLFEKNYLGRIYSHKLLENTKPAIYFLSNNGILWCRVNMGYVFANDEFALESKDMKKFYEDKKASKIFINHSIAICEIYLQLKSYEKENESEYEFTTKTQWWTETKNDEDYFYKKVYMPDAFFEKNENLGSKKMSSITFRLELFDHHVPRYAMEYKVRLFIQYHDVEDNLWKKEKGRDGKFPRILFILMNGRKLGKLKKYIQEQLDWSYEAVDIVFYLTTYKKVLEKGIGDQSIWTTVTGQE